MKHLTAIFEDFTVYFCSKIVFSKASFATEFDFLKTQFYLKTLCVVKMLIQHLTRCKNSFKNWWVVKKLIDRHTRINFFDSKTVCHSSSFVVFFLFKEAVNCHPWNLCGVFLHKKIYSKACLATGFDFLKKHISTW